MEERQSENVWEERRQYEAFVKCKVAAEYVLSLTSASQVCGIASLHAPPHAAPSCAAHISGKMYPL